MMNVVLECAPRERMGLFLSVGVACITLGPACGPVVSGLMVTLFGWRAIFAVPLAGGVIVAVSGAVLMRNEGERRGGRLDVPSLVLLAVGLTAFVFSVGGLSEDLLLGACVLVVALVLVGMFAHWQLALGRPHHGRAAPDRSSRSASTVSWSVRWPSRLWRPRLTCP